MSNIDIYVHIGLPKTSSTYLQEYFFPKLALKNIAFNPKEIMDIIHELIIRLDNYENLSEHELKRSSGKIYSILINKSIDKLVISEEAFTIKKYQFIYKDKISMLNSIFINPKFILIIREQVSWLRSLYKQAIHQQNIKNINEFIELENVNSDKLDIINVNYLDYFELIRHIRDISSNKEHLIFFYENYLSDKEKYLKKIIKFFNLKYNNIPINNEKVNRSISMLGLIFLITVNKSFSYLSIKLNYKTHVFLRNIFQNYLDKLIYINWDPMLKYKNLSKINILFKKYNKKLLDTSINDKIPDKYL